MPCCGLSEFRVKVPAHLSVAGVALLSLAFTVAFVVGLATAWRPLGRGILRVQGAFLAALWREAMRNPQAAPARWSCRMSGYLLPVSPRLASWVSGRPELPLAAATTVVLAVVGGTAWLLLA
jgi:hypothetical protein